MEKTKIISIMTNCAICNKLTIKKNGENGIYLCTECNSLHDMEKINKLQNILKNKK